MLYLFIGEGKFPYVGHVFYIVEGYALEIFFRNLFDVLAVVLADYDIGDAGALGCEYLLLDAAYWQNLSAQGDFARHSCVLAHLALGDG